MKKLTIFFMAMFLLQAKSIKAQITLEHTYLTNTSTPLFQEFFLTNLGNNDYKYVIYDYGYSSTSSFSLYNLDYTPYMLNISIPLASDTINNIYYRLGYITTTLFDCDSSNIEYAMMLDVPHPSQHPNFAIYRTDGTLLFSKDTIGTIFCVGCGSGSYEMHPIMNTPNGAKLLLFNYNTNNFFQNTYIYGLCGTLPDNITEINQSNDFVKVFPNPTSNQINFEITAPSHSDEYELTIFNAAFQSIKTNSIKGETKINLDVQPLSSGTYFYSLQNKNKVFQTGKFVITK
jgi:hypothetical protein